MSGVGLALLCGLWAGFATADFGYTLGDMCAQPVFIGTILGALMGDIETGMLVGGSLELLFLGIIFPGGTVPADASTSSLIAIPIAIATGLEPEAATVLAVPFGLLGAMMWNVKGSLFTIWPTKVDAMLERGDYAGVKLYTRVLPPIVSALLFGVPVFLANLAGPAVVEAFIEAVPDWAMNGLEVAGGVLPAIGFAIALNLIGRKEILPFFFIGYFVVQYFELEVVGVAIFAACIAAIYLFMGGQGTGVQEDVAAEERAEGRILAPADVTGSFRRWWTFCEVCSSNDRLQSLSHMTSIYEPLRKLYPDDADFVAALQRNAQFYNTEGIIGSVVNGMTLSMEEERALGVGVPDEVIYSVRTALMGPMAGIGDSLVWGTTKTIFMSIATSLALSANPLGALLGPVWTVLTFLVGLYLYRTGYSLGRTAVMRMLKSGIMDRIITAAGIMGLTMIGALSASYIWIELLPEFELESAADPVSIQGIFDSIAPGLVPLGVLGLVYLFIKRHPNRYGTLVLLIIACSLVLSLLGIV